MLSRQLSVQGKAALYLDAAEVTDLQQILVKDLDRIAKREEKKEQDSP